MLSTASLVGELAPKPPGEAVASPFLQSAGFGSASEAAGPQVSSAEAPVLTPQPKASTNLPSSVKTFTRPLARSAAYRRPVSKSTERPRRPFSEVASPHRPAPSPGGQKSRSADAGAAAHSATASVAANAPSVALYPVFSRVAISPLRFCGPCRL